MIISQNSQERTCVGDSFEKGWTGFNTVVYLQFLKIVWEHLFYRRPPDDCLCIMTWRVSELYSETSNSGYSWGPNVNDRWLEVGMRGILTKYIIKTTPVLPKPNIRGVTSSLGKIITHCPIYYLSYKLGNCFISQILIWKSTPKHMTVHITWFFKKWSLPIQKTNKKRLSEAHSRPSEISKIDVFAKN